MTPGSNPSDEARAALHTIDLVESHRQRRENEQRRASRKTVRAEALITPLLESALSLDPIRISVRNISMTGMGFIASVPIPPGTLWRMSLLVDKHTLGQQAFTVRHCRAVSAGVCIIGAQFCADSTMLAMMGMKLDELSIYQSSEDTYDVDFVSPDSLL